MSEVCELLVTTGEGQILAGVIELNDDGTLSSGYSDGYEHLVSEVLDTPVFGVDPKEDSKLWFEALPLQYTGSYFRVAKVGGIKAYGTSEGVRRAWDTRGRGVKALDELPAAEIMKEPGTAKIPAGTIRLYHYTGGEGLEDTRNNLASIVEHGIRQDRAKGESYGEPSVVWGSTAKPHDFKEFVEFWVKPDEIGIGKPQSREYGKQLSQEEIDEFNAGNHDVTLHGDVAPERIIGVHEDWHGSYRYAAQEDSLQKEIKEGGMNYLLDPSSRWYNDKDSIGLRRWIKDNPQFAPKDLKAAEEINLDAAVEELLSYGTSEGVTKAWDTRGRKGPEVELLPGVRKMTGEDAKYLETWRQIANRQVATGDLKRSVRKAANVAEWIANDWEDENYGSRSKADKSQFFVVQTPENGIVGSINIHPGIEFGYDHISSLATRPDVISGVVKEHGVGTKLMIQAAKYAASRNHGLDLSALDGAEGFYRKLGMHETPPASRDKMSEFEWTADEVKQMSEGKVN